MSLPQVAENAMICRRHGYDGVPAAAAISSAHDLFRKPGPTFRGSCFKRALIDLADARARQRVEEGDVLWPFILDEILLAVIEQLFGGETGARFADNEYLHGFAAEGVRRAHRGGLSGVTSISG